MRAKCSPPCAAWCSRMHMGRPVMEDARAAPRTQLRDNASHVLLGRVYWQGRKAVWAGRKHFTLDIRSDGTEQPVCDCLCVCVCTRLRVSVHVQAITCERLSVWDMCGRVCVCVGGWAAFLSIKVTSRPPSASGEKWTMPDTLSTVVLLPPFPSLIHPEWLWVGQTHLAGQRHHRKLTHRDAGIPGMLIQTMRAHSSKTYHTRSVSVFPEGGSQIIGRLDSNTQEKRVWGSTSSAKEPTAGSEMHHHFEL